ncbi:MAG: hypothetical protein H7Y86_20645 [Rhizobacter sp.]|nr:hypothetical protein [Ferruginibacter sp.]
MKKSILKLSLTLVAAAVFLASCKKDEGETNDEEIITTFIVKLTPPTGPIVEFKYDDPDGPGGNAATTQEIVVAPNTTYQVSFSLLNKTITPSDITQEIIDEKNDHQFYITKSGGVNLTINNLSTDSNNFPFGQTSTWITGALSTGKVVIVLKHKPGIKGANDPVILGDTDIDTDEAFGGFLITIQ